MSSTTPANIFVPEISTNCLSDDLLNDEIDDEVPVVVVLKSNNVFAARIDSYSSSASKFLIGKTFVLN